MHTQTSSALHNDTVSSCSTFNVQEKTQEDHSNPIRPLNVDSLKVDSVVIQNPCSETEDSNSETASSKSVKESILDSATKEVHAIKYKMSKAKERCMTYFRSLHSHLQVLSKEDLKGTRQHGQVLNAESNKAKIKKEIDVLETINIEFEYKVANFRKENETLKKNYKDLYDSIKFTRSKTIEQTTFLLADNADLKAHIQEKVFVIAALKNDLRKLKGNSVDTKFAKTSVLGKPVLQPLRQPNVFKHKRPPMSKQRFSSQVDVNHSLSKPVTQHYLPKKSESALVKPDHMIASSSSRNSSKNMPRFSSNDMVHIHYLDEAKKKTQERDRNSKPSVMTPARFQSATADSKPKPRSTNHSSRSLPMSKSSCVTMPAMPKADHTKSPRKLFDFCTNKVESEPPHCSNIDISKIHKNKQTLDLSAGTSINVSKEQSLDTMASDQNNYDPAPECQTMTLNHDSLSPAIQRQGK
nr:hypothetical protein [Tanacetum cinerariifolium]